ARGSVLVGAALTVADSVLKHGSEFQSDPAHGSHDRRWAESLRRRRRGVGTCRDGRLQRVVRRSPGDRRGALPSAVWWAAALVPRMLPARSTLSLGTGCDTDTCARFVTLDLFDRADHGGPAMDGKVALV